MRRHTSLALFAVLALVYLLAGTWTTRRVGPTGDEPYYLLAADSLLHGEGFALDARWAEIAASGYDPGDHLADLPRQSAPSLRRPGHFPLHDLGLSVILAAPFAIGGRGLAVALVGLSMAAAVALAHRAARRLLPSRAALGGALLGGLSVPAITYSGQLFPDSVMPLAVAAGVAAIVGAAPLWAGALGIAALPFLHLRGWPLALALLLLLARGRSWRDRARLCAPLGAVVLGVSLVDLSAYGIAVPHAGFLLFFAGRGDTSLADYSATTPLGVLGLFVDRAFGLLPAAPVAILAFVGAGVALRRHSILPLLAIPYLLLASAVDWTGGVSPQARYLAPLVPLLIVFLGLGLATRPGRLLALLLGPLTAVMTAVYVVVPGVRYDSLGLPPFSDRTLDRAIGLHASGVFPLLGTDGATAALLAMWTVLLVVAGIVGARSPAVTRLSSSPTTISDGASL